MISLGFVESDARQIVRKAAQLISPMPYRHTANALRIK